MSADLRLLGVVPRVVDLGDAARAARDVVAHGDAIDLDGVLLFTGTGALLDPWIGAAAVAAGTRRMVPLVALSPLYSHPFAAARAILSIAELYGRRVDLNLVTGASLAEMRRIGDGLDHGARYARAQEYAELVRDLLEGRPVTRDGRWYPVEDLHLGRALAPRLRPRLHLAGDSDDARRAAAALDATSLGMWPAAGPDAGLRHEALHVGVLARTTTAEAQEAARAAFPDDPVGREVFDWSMSDSDSRWKRDLVSAARDGRAVGPVRLLPFTSLQADGPYLVGDHATVAGELARAAACGVHTVVLDALDTAQDREHLGAVVRLLREVSPGG